MSNIVKKKLNIIYKKIIINLFYLIYSKPTKRTKKIDNSEKIYDLSIDKNHYKIFEFRNGRIYTDSNDTTATYQKIITFQKHQSNIKNLTLLTAEIKRF